ncbi:LacI family DNA-binding transcriptional regulator [Microbacterium sp. NPDC055683]
MAQQEGRGRPTMKDVAEAAGVSRALVSIVFRDAPGAGEETRRHVREVAERLGYRMDRRAQLLRQSRTRTLGVVFDVHAAFHGELVEELYLAAASRGLALSLSAITPMRTEGVAVESLLDERVEGLVLLGSALPAAALLDVADRIPSVAVARPTGGAMPAARTDDRAGGRLAARHLVELGRRRVVYLDGGDVAGGRERREGHLEAMAEAGLPADIIAGGLDEEAGVRAARELLDRPQLPDAVAAFNDRCAIGVLDALLRAGVDVPRDVAVIGFDDIRAGRLETIGLSTIAQDAAGLASDAVDLVVDGRPGAERVRAPRLVVRRTTAR